MKGFLLGLLVAALAAAGYLYWKEAHKAPVPVKPMAPSADAGVTPVRHHRKRARGAARMARVAAGGAGPERHPTADDPVVPPEPEPVHLSQADLRTVGQGDDLSRPDVIHLDMTHEQDGRELTQDDIDAKFRLQEGAILDCITGSRPDPETYVPGRVTIKFRIQRPGSVRGVRVEAPAILMKGGLYACVKGIVGRLSFPASGSSQVVSYPFSLN